MKNYKIFISHSWNYNSDYYTIENWLDENLSWKNMSVPKHDALESSTDQELKEKIENRIKLSSGILIISGMYVNHSGWINTEIELAIKYGKAIIGIKPRGNERTPTVISENAIIVNWNSNSIINAIEENF